MRLRASGANSLPISDLKGLNRKDASERVFDNQFYNLQNFYQEQKGAFQKRFGSTQDLSASQLAGARRVSGMYRHHSPNKEKYTIYFCEPDTTSLPDNTTDLTLADITGGGDIFGGAAVVPLYVCYSFVGLGIEQNYNSKSRSGFPSLPVNAWSNPAHQSITLAANTNTLRVTAPGIWPLGVRSCNVFIARGGASTCQMTYMGTIYSPGGILDIKRFIGPAAAASDSMGTPTPSTIYTSNGKLKAGTYYISTAPVTDPNVQEGSNAYSITTLFPAVAVTVVAETNTIQVQIPTVVSANGAKSAYVFIGSQDQNSHAMVCVGVVNSTDVLQIQSIPDNSNAQSHSYMFGASLGVFDATVRAASIANTNRFGFVLKKDDAGIVTEIFPSRTLYGQARRSTGVSDIYSGTTLSQAPETTYLGWPKTAYDKWTGITGSAQPYNWGRTVYDPVFAYLNGLTFFVNGVDIPWQTDGKAMSQIIPSSGTMLPPYPRFILAYQNSLVAVSGETIYFTNALSPNNWAQGGSGTLKNFLSIGDLFGDDLTAIGIYTIATDGINDPKSFIVPFKKHGVWMKSSLTFASICDQLSGMNGCVAFRSICSTPSGLAFVGYDGDIYLINGPGEPKRIGTSVQPLLAHLVNNDSLMQMVTATFHNNYLKISYPSSSTSTYNDAQIWADMRVGPRDPITWHGPMTGINVGPQIVLVGESDDGSRWAARSDVLGTVKLDDTSVMTDLGISITSIMESKLFRMRDFKRAKRYFGILFDAYWDSSFSHSILIEGFADEDYQQINKTLSTGGAVWDSNSFDQASYSDAFYQAIACMFASTNLIGNTFKFRLTHSNAAQFVVAGAEILFKPERRIAI